MKTYRETYLERRIKELKKDIERLEDTASVKNDTILAIIKITKETVELAGMYKEEADFLKDEVDFCHGYKH